MVFAQVQITDWSIWASTKYSYNWPGRRCDQLHFHSSQRCRPCRVRLRQVGTTYCGLRVWGKTIADNWFGFYSANVYIVMMAFFFWEAYWPVELFIVQIYCITYKHTWSKFLIFWVFYSSTLDHARSGPAYVTDS